jgi:hypothetical protein
MIGRELGPTNSSTSASTSWLAMITRDAAT